LKNKILSPEYIYKHVSENTMLKIAPISFWEPSLHQQSQKDLLGKDKAWSIFPLAIGHPEKESPPQELKCCRDQSQIFPPSNHRNKIYIAPKNKKNKKKSPQTQSTTATTIKCGISP